MAGSYKLHIVKEPMKGTFRYLIITVYLSEKERARERTTTYTKGVIKIASFQKHFDC